LYESGSESDSDDAPRPKVCAYVGRFSGLRLIGFLLTSLRDGASSHPFAPLMFLLGALILFALGILEQARSHGGRR